MDELYIGQQVQAFRQMRAMSIRELSKRSGITSSMLSQIERELVNPSINTLRAVAKALDVPLYRFFKEDSHSKDLVVRSSARKTIGHPGQRDVTYDLLTPDVTGSIEFCMMHIPAGGNSGEPGQEHNGEEVSYVVKGLVNITLGADLYALEPGDSIRIPPMTPHRWENTGKGDVEVIFAVTPPSF